LVGDSITTAGFRLGNYKVENAGMGVQFGGQEVVIYLGISSYA